MLLISLACSIYFNSQNMLETGQNAHESEKTHGLIIAAYGEGAKRIVNGILQETVPFVGAERPKGYSGSSRMGVGLELTTDKNRPLFWGLIYPHDLPQSWKAMKLLEGLGSVEFNNDLLEAIWYSSQVIPPFGSEEQYLNKLYYKYGKDKVIGLRGQILPKNPPETERQRMFKVFADNQIKIDDSIEMDTTRQRQNSTGLPPEFTRHTGIFGNLFGRGKKVKV